SCPVKRVLFLDLNQLLLRRSKHSVYLVTRHVPRQYVGVHHQKTGCPSHWRGYSYHLARIRSVGVTVPVRSPIKPLHYLLSAGRSECYWQSSSQTNVDFDSSQIRNEQACHCVCVGH